VTGSHRDPHAREPEVTDHHAPRPRPATWNSGPAACPRPDRPGSLDPACGMAAATRSCAVKGWAGTFKMLSEVPNGPRALLEARGIRILYASRALAPKGTWRCRNVTVMKVTLHRRDT
jgi:hypothetical protein